MSAWSVRYRLFECLFLLRRQLLHLLRHCQELHKLPHHQRRSKTLPLKRRLRPNLHHRQLPKIHRQHLPTLPIWLLVLHRSLPILVLQLHQYCRPRQCLQHPHLLPEYRQHHLLLRMSFGAIPKNRLPQCLPSLRPVVHRLFRHCHQLHPN